MICSCIREVAILSSRSKRYNKKPTPSGLQSAGTAQFRRGSISAELDVRKGDGLASQGQKKKSNSLFCLHDKVSASSGVPPAGNMNRTSQSIDLVPPWLDGDTMETAKKQNVVPTCSGRYSSLCMVASELDDVLELINHHPVHLCHLSAKPWIPRTYQDTARFQGPSKRLGGRLLGRGL